jgi:hypothetical protein
MDASKFIKIYANLPLGMREDIVTVIDNKPLTWNAAYVEIDNQTKIGQEILSKLEELEII